MLDFAFHRHIHADEMVLMSGLLHWKSVVRHDPVGCPVIAKRR